MDLQLSDLHNPQGIKAIYVHNTTQDAIIEADPVDQGFQEYPGSIELWQKMPNGQLMRVQRWLRKSVIVIWTK